MTTHLSSPSSVGIDVWAGCEEPSVCVEPGALKAGSRRPPPTCARNTRLRASFSRPQGTSSGGCDWIWWSHAGGSAFHTPAVGARLMDGWLLSHTRQAGGAFTAFSKGHAGTGPQGVGQVHQLLRHWLGGRHQAHPSQAATPPLASAQDSVSRWRPWGQERLNNAPRWWSELGFEPSSGFVYLTSITKKMCSLKKKKKIEMNK